MLNPNTGSSLANTALDAQISRLENNEALLSNSAMAVELADAYHAYASESVLLGADTSTGNKAFLESVFVADNSSNMAAIIASGICDYWSSIVTAGAPAHGGTAVVSVVVNGGSVLAAMTAAIESTITDKAQADGWKNFFTNTEAVVKTIPCVITEMMPTTPPAPQAFPETIT